MADWFPESDPASTALARRNYIRYSISEDDWRNKSGASLMRSMKSALGQSIRKTDFLEIRRQKLAEIERKDQFTDLDKDGLVPYSLMNQDTGIQLTMTAQYRVRLTAIDPETGKPFYVYRALSSDRHHAPGYVEEYAKTMFSMGGEGYSYDIVESVLHDVWLTPGGHLTG